MREKSQKPILLTSESMRQGGHCPLDKKEREDRDRRPIFVGKSNGRQMASFGAGVVVSWAILCPSLAYNAARDIANKLLLKLKLVPTVRGPICLYGVASRDTSAALSHLKL